MAADLMPYPAVKHSGADWLGDVPEHWELRRTKTLLKQRTEKGFPNEPLLAATQTKGVVRKEEYENRTVLALKDLHLLKLVRVGDFVISLRSFQGGIEYARERGIISPAYTVLFPVRPDDHRYLAHLFKSAPYVENLSFFVTGIRQGQNIDYARLARSRLPLPPSVERRAIACFLDHAKAHIQRYVRAKERLIELLEEQREIGIQQAVTGQIDVRTGQPYPAYRDSGVEWLGNVPEHWRVGRNRWLFQERTETGFGSLPVLEVSLRDGVRIRDMKGGQRKQRIVDRNQYKRAKKDDIAYNTMRMWQGAVGVVPEDGLVSPAYVVMAPVERMESRYYGYLFRTEIYKNAVKTFSRGIVSDRDRLYWDGFKRIASFVPPLEEQSAIVDFLDHAGRRIEAQVSATKRQIDLLREYRTRLIADVVTGKLDVREAAARLPEVDSIGGGGRVDATQPESKAHATDYGVAGEAGA
ncbi:restriction endonuclease subunit S [Candidatus Palauibacter sp.]|uniref:restriction endonuclease subunit S n=1 Tax=Candidatus Palauibacter sp. TaxID=3101350 RepID=UPI003D0FF4ED